MKTYVEFCSDRFPASEGEDEEVNPGRFGKRLAEYLAGRLPAHGFQIKSVAAEDWGWRISLFNDGFDLWIGCGNSEEHPDAFLCFSEPHSPVIRRLFRKIDTADRVTALQQAMDAVLEEPPGVRDRRWWTHDEFNSADAA